MSSKYDGTPDERLALDAYIALMRAANALTQRAHQHLAGAKLTIGQFGVLEALVHVGALRQHELAKKLLCSAGNLSIVLNNLERRGLVRRETDRSDARCTIVHVTESGTALIQRIFPQHVARLVTEFAVLSADEQVTLRTLCRRVGLHDDALLK